MRHLLFFLLFLAPFLLGAQIPADYYTVADGKTGAELKAILHSIIKNHKTFPYTSSATDVWTILKESDRDPNNSANVILIYSGLSVNAAQEYNSGNGWTREHVWAKSRGDFGTTQGAGTDCHHLRPENDVVNSIRSNYYFDEGGSPVLYNSIATGCFKNSLTSTFEPRDVVKGDVARMIMYMAVRYEGENGEPDLEMTESIFGDSDKQPLMGVKSTLMRWNLEDLPDDFERNRNEVVYDYQGNRNPFIDHPEYATAIWSSSSTAVDDDSAKPEQSLYFSNNQLNITSALPIQTVRIYSVTGQIVLSQEYNNVESVQIAADRLPKGVCLVVVNGNKAMKAVLK